LFLQGPEDAFIQYMLDSVKAHSDQCSFCHLIYEVTKDEWLLKQGHNVSGECYLSVSASATVPKYLYFDVRAPSNESFQGSAGLELTTFKNA
jgi:hypothetical protein